MGSFSFTRAEHTTKRSNLALSDAYKILIPIEFGGGYIEDTYYDYGKIFHYNKDNRIWVDANGEKHRIRDSVIPDLYGVVAYFNRCEGLKYDGNHFPKDMKEILENGRTNDQHNRYIGIEISCYTKDVNKLEYPLKLVSTSYSGTYEDCKGRSYSDPEQGLENMTWRKKAYKEYLELLIEAEEETSSVIERNIEM